MLRQVLPLAHVWVVQVLFLVQLLVGLLGELQTHWVSVGLELASLIQYMENNNFDYE